MSARTLFLTVGYDGTDFSGYQIQAAGRTVQGVLEQAIDHLHGHHVRTIVAGRTDAGVHATNQCVSIMTDHPSISVADMAAAINSRLPADVRILGVREVPDGAHARYDALRRHYRYHMLVSPYGLPHLRRYAWRIPFAPDLQAVNRDATALIGTHDFTTFAARREKRDSMVRTIAYAHIDARGDRVTFAIGADGFLWRMVRSIVGTLMERDRDRRRGVDLPDIRELLAARDRSQAGTTAPAWGLFLSGVDYPDWSGQTHSDGTAEGGARDE